MKQINSQKGFTLIELMIALVLGLVIMAAVVQVYIMSTRTAVAQKAGSDILDANVFGLQQVETNLRLAGLDLAQSSSNKQNFSGIVLGADNLKDITGVTNDLFTDSNVGPTRTNRAGSDQLTIQYRAPVDIKSCDGVVVLGEKEAFLNEKEEDGSLVKREQQLPLKGQLVVEKYFLADSNNDGTLELRCKGYTYETLLIHSYATKYESKIAADPDLTKAKALRASAQDKLVPLNDNAQGALLADAIDDFKVLLAVADYTKDATTGAVTDNGILYLTPQEYLSAHEGKPILAVKTAILARGKTANLSGKSAVNVNAFNLLGEDVQLASGVNTNYLRRVYESNSMLRNSREKE